MESRAVLFLLTIGLLLSSCSTVPITGKKQLSLIPQSEMLSMSYQQHGDFLKAGTISADEEKARLVRNVGQRIRKAVERFYPERKMSDELKEYRWEVNLVDSREVNAWCMPGGKVVVHTPILPLTETDAGLAVVLGHEVAHAIAGHGGERMSRQLLAEFGGVALSAAVHSEPQRTRDLWMSVSGAGVQVGVRLPFRRAHESEADHLSPENRTS